MAWVERQAVTRPTVADVRRGVIEIRRRKGMVLDPADPDNVVAATTQGMYRRTVAGGVATWNREAVPGAGAELASERRQTSPPQKWLPRR